MRALTGGFALVLVATLAACGGGSTATRPTPDTSLHSSCSGVAGKHHAFVIVQHGNGTLLKGCVGFDGATLSGFSLMKDSHLEVQTASDQYGIEICQIDNEPAHYDKCLPANAPYWNNWQWNGSSWAQAQTGYAVMKFSDHQALGWVYTSPTASPAPPPRPPSG